MVIVRGKSFSKSDLACTAEFSANDFCRMREFNRVCRYHNFSKGQGLVGKALLSHKPFLCRDVTQLPINEYPLALADNARKCGLTGCFAICLRDCTSNEDYVLEFFLPPSTDYGDSINIDTKDPQDFLDKLLATIKKHFQGFKIASGKELGEELSVEEVNFDRVEEICPITSPPLESGETVQLLEEQLTVETVGKNGLNVPDTKQNQVDFTSSVKTCAVKTSKRKHKATGSSFSLEEIQQCFGMKLEDAAERLGISLSTLKRRCKELDIKWPYPKRKKVNKSSNLKQSNEFVQCGNEQNPDFRIDPLCTPLPPTSHTITNATPSQDVRTVTVKAIHGDDIYKFELPFSSKMADLVEKLNIRLPLKDVPLSIKYEDKEGDRVAIACDEDLERCMRSSRSLLDKTTLEILVKGNTT